MKQLMEKYLRLLDSAKKADESGLKKTAAEFRKLAEKVAQEIEG